MQIFPVRGHSYCQCDRNFAVYSRRLKNIECVEMPEEYDDIIRGAKKTPFVIRHDVVKDFESGLKPYFIKMNIEISKACALIFRVDGSIEVHKNYALANGASYTVGKQRIPRDGFETLHQESVKGVAELK